MKTYREFIVEATAVAKAKFKKQFDAVRHSDVFQNTQYKRGGINQWHLTGHNPGAKYGTTKDIEAVKEKVFGKRRKGTSDLLFLHHKHGIVIHPAIGDVTHADVLAHDDLHSKPRPGIKVNKKIQAKVKEGGIGGIIGQGRIEHHEGGGGIISYSHHGVGSRAAAVRTIARAYPKYQIHDGYGNLLENFHAFINEAPVSYTAVMLDQRSHDLLMSRMRPHMPEGWKVYAHHMTMHMGAAKPEDKVGQSVTIVADAWAADERTVAVRVTGHPSRNRTPHVTVAVNAAAGAKPKDSNLHTEWKPMPPLRLTGTVGEA